MLRHRCSISDGNIYQTQNRHTTPRLCRAPHHAALYHCGRCSKLGYVSPQGSFITQRAPGRAGRPSYIGCEAERPPMSKRPAHIIHGQEGVRPALCHRFEDGSQARSNFKGQVYNGHQESKKLLLCAALTGIHQRRCMCESGGPRQQQAGNSISWARGPPGVIKLFARSTKTKRTRRSFF